MIDQLLLFLADTTPKWITIGGWIFGGGTILAVIAWARFRKKDVADVSKTDAETEKLKADALLVKANADVTVADAALKLAQRLSDECNMAKIDLKEKENALEKTQSDLNSVRNSLTQALEKIESLQAELDKERIINADMAEKNRLMQEKIRELTEQIKILTNQQ